MIKNKIRKLYYWLIRKLVGWKRIPTEAFGTEYFYETKNGWIRFPTLPHGRYIPNYGYIDAKQQIYIAEEVVKMCKEFLNKNNDKK